MHHERGRQSAAEIRRTAKPSVLATEDHQVAVAAVLAQESLCQEAALEEGVELVFDAKV